MYTKYWLHLKQIKAREKTIGTHRLRFNNLNTHKNRQTRIKKTEVTIKNKMNTKGIKTAHKDEHKTMLVKYM